MTIEQTRAGRPITRRRALKTTAAGAAGFVAASRLGFPAIVRAQADAIKIGHLTPLTGFLE
jgi:branched-chain amino acid transport system substrate-binding protein